MILHNLREIIYGDSYFSEILQKNWELIFADLSYENKKENFTDPEKKGEEII